jgi:hypothetical protein
VLDPARVSADGIFNAQAVTWLLDRAQTAPRLGELENMALIGLVSFGLFKQAFWETFSARADAHRYQADITGVADYRSVVGEPALAL